MKRGKQFIAVNTKKDYDKYYYSVRLAKLGMRQIIRQIIEVRCNFCFNWINAPNLVKGEFNSCIDCLNQHINTKTTVHTPEGDIYKLQLTKEVKWSELKDFVQNSNIVEEVSQELDQSPKNNKALQSISRDKRCRSATSELMDIKISEINRDGHHQTQHLMDFVRIINQATTMSQFLDKRQGEELKPHQSCVFNTPVKQKMRQNYSSYKKIAKLQDFGRSLDKTRFLQRYQFYHDQNVIQSFIEEHPKIDERSYKSKQFGNQISSNEMNRSMSLKSKIGNSKSHRSNISSDSQIQKLEGDEIKSKISCFLESKYHSESLTRLMTTYLKQAYEKTTLQNRTLELTNYKISSLDIHTYLSMFDFEYINIIKLVNVDLSDLQIPVLINFIWDKPVQSLVLTGNKLTENCFSVFLNKGLPYLKELYLGNNRINKGKLKQNVAELQSRFILYL